jgi:hypothetical protein
MNRIEYNRIVYLIKRPSRGKNNYELYGGLYRILILKTIRLIYEKHIDIHVYKE